MLVPPGDHTGARSAAPELWLRLRASPSLTGTVKISPRASMSTRLPVGDREAAAMRRLTSSQRASAHGKSPRTVMSSRRARPVSGSSVWIQPSCSNTRPSRPPDNHLTSASAKCVSCRSAPDATSYAQTFAAQSLSDTK